MFVKYRMVSLHYLSLNGCYQSKEKMQLQHNGLYSVVFFFQHCWRPGVCRHNCLVHWDPECTSYYTGPWEITAPVSLDVFFFLFFHQEYVSQSLWNKLLSHFLTGLLWNFVHCNPCLLNAVFGKRNTHVMKGDQQFTFIVKCQHSLVFHTIYTYGCMFGTI